MALLVLAGCAVLYFNDPSDTWWMPPCVFRSLTSLQCPSCGSTRALHALLHGDVAAMLGYNPFVVVSWPVMAFVAVYCYVRRGRVYSRWFWAVIYAYLALYVIWWVVRNVYDL